MHTQRASTCVGLAVWWSGSRWVAAPASGKAASQRVGRSRAHGPQHSARLQARGSATCRRTALGTVAVACTTLTASPLPEWSKGGQVPLRGVLPLPFPMLRRSTAALPSPTILYPGHASPCPGMPLPWHAPALACPCPSMHSPPQAAAWRAPSPACSSGSQQGCSGARCRTLLCA